jgi:plastocyanin
VVIRVTNSTFEPASVSAPSDATFTLYFDNADALPHNIVLLAPDGSRSFSGDVFTGPAQRVYEVPALASGAYRLHCDVHPEMTGTLTVP